MGTQVEPQSRKWSLSTVSDGSMVEIKREAEANLGSPMTESAIEDEKYRLLYSKSKVYIHPTAYSRDNIPGFVTLVKREAVNPKYLLAWIPETLLNERGQDEWDKFVRIEERASVDDEDEDAVLIDLPVRRPETYAFSVPFTSIYSLIVHPPTISSWHGSIAINLISGSTLPTLYFHDDESRSFSTSPVAPPISRNTSTQGSGASSYPPRVLDSGAARAHGMTTTWGGEDLLARLRQYAHILRSNLQPTLFLVDPSKADIEAHTMQLFDDDAVDDILGRSSYANSYSPVPAHRRPRPLSSASTNTQGSSSNTRNGGANPYSQHSSVLHRSLHPPFQSNSGSQARSALLQSFASITRATRHAAQQILSHPLAQPIVPHLPDPVKSLVSASGETEWGSWVEKGGVGEFESARVYLARWARIVAEEGERARQQEARSIPSNESPTATEEEEGSLGVFELLHSSVNLPKPRSTRDPRHPLDEETWLSWFGKDGRPRIKKEEMRKEVFRKGVSPKGTLRKRVWPLLLGVLEWDATDAERDLQWEEKRKEYHRLKDEWYGVDEVFNRQDVIEERHRIDVDCRRTDRTQPLFLTPSPATTPTTASAKELKEKDANQRYSSFSPNMNDVGAQAPTNDHIERLSGILLTYNFFEKSLGYVQGMSDLCAPIYVVMSADEEMTFWCFVEVMNRMKQNFLRDQSGMKKQLLSLQQLISVMDPELYRHLEKTDGLNLFFCFRWVLIAFKREFAFDDVLRLWEVLWTDYYSANFVLFVALAILESHRDVILRYLIEFDEILKYCNELSMTIELDTTLAQAEVLFLSFAQLVADIDRRRAENDTTVTVIDGGLRRRNGSNDAHSSAGPSAQSTARQSTVALPLISDNLRELLQTRQ